MPSSSPVAAACTTFSLSLFRELSETSGATANVFYSPFSISSALAMVLLGARGNTAAQMTQVLCLSEAEEPSRAAAAAATEQTLMQQQQVQMTRLPLHLQKSLHIHGVQGDVHVDFSKLLSDLNKTGTSYSLSVANRLYGEQSYQFVGEFLSATEKHYNAQLESVDFKTQAESARVNINGWVEKQTQDKIKDLLAAGVLDEMTRLVLVNAIYFKGMWDKPFKAASTRDAQFRVSKTETKPVKMMYQSAKFPLAFIPDMNCQVLELPYTGKDLSMLIFLPIEMEDSTTGLEKLEKALTYENFVDWTNPDMMDNMTVQVGLPRFKMEQTYDMKQVLTKMGMVDAFDMAQCDFSGMSPANDLVLSKVVHKAFVEVNEEGTEAAAATAAVMMMRCAMMPAKFVADHPFLFFIRHNPSTSILFAGRYCSPA